MTADPHKENNAFSIAIIGMSGRFPGANTLEAYWQNLVNQVESISTFSDDELRDAGIDQSLIDDPAYVKAAPILDGPGLFDAAFFGYSPREAQAMDPQQRLFLETAWEALEQAGYDPDRVDSPIGVFGGSAMNTYLLFSGLLPHFVSDYLPTLIGNDKDFLTTRVSYKLNLKGPSVTVQTACSTSLVAVHLACQSLLNEECDMALAGGATVRVPHVAGHLFEEGSVFTPNGHCRTFDAGADGTIFGSGVGVVALKRLEDALDDGDTIHAVIKGSAINNDGASKADYTAPSVNSQSEAIIEALANADISADSISYVETHGTGTYLGDPIEIAALTRAFRTQTTETNFCAIGSVKTNIGHLDAAAGIAGLIKTVLALKHKQIPASLNFDTGNPEIAFETTPFYVNNALAQWPENACPRRAGVSALGIGGTNAHIVLEEAPTPTATDSSTEQQLLVLSAKTETALETASTNLATYLKQHPDIPLADVAYTLQRGRKLFGHRRMVVCHNRNDGIAALTELDSNRTYSHYQAPIEREVVFMFPGQGAQYVNMGRLLYETHPIFRENVDRCAALLLPSLGFDLRDILYPNGADADTAAEKLRQTGIAQPALFAVEYSLAQLWLSWGVEPSVLVGHSIGEYVAACLAGVFSLEDALALVGARGQLMQSLPSGSMLAVPLNETEISPFLNDQLAIGLINNPAMVVVSGATSAVEALQRSLAEKEVVTRLLHTSHAFHSPMMEPILAEFAAKVGTLQLNAPSIPIVSNLTGDWLQASQATDPAYWAAHIRQTVRFADCIQTLLQEPKRVFLESGPGQTLSTLVKQHPGHADPDLVIPSTRHPRQKVGDDSIILKALGQLWAVDVKIDWTALYRDQRRQRIPLPTYPFERQHYWIEATSQSYGAPAPTGTRTKKQRVGDWFYTPSWHRTPLLRHNENRPQDGQKWLIFVGTDDFSNQLAEHLTSLDQAVVLVRKGDGFTRRDSTNYRVDPQGANDYRALIQALLADNQIPSRIVHAWDGAPTTSSSDPGCGFYSLLYLVQAFESQNLTQPLQLQMLTNHLYDVTGSQTLSPEKALAAGLLKVIPQEHPQLQCQSVDIALSPDNKGWEQPLIASLLNEFEVDRPDPVVAYQGQHRWIQTLEPYPIPADLPPEHSILRLGGVYLITGGLGEIGLILAKTLAQTQQAKLVLLGRSPLPHRQAWPTWLAQHPDTDATSRKIQAVQSLEELGAEVLVLSADVADSRQMEQVLQQTKSQFGPLHGVIHAAGIVDSQNFTPLSTTGATQIEAHFQAKVHGLKTLDRVLKSEPLDFCLLVSSISSILGGIGFAAYAAANSFMDAFAQERNRSGSTRWLSVNWDHWQLASSSERVAGDTDAANGILPEEGAAAFRSIMTEPFLSQIVVSTTDLNARLDQWVHFKTAPEPVAQTRPPQATPKPRSDYVAPRNEIEQTIANIWQELLGHDQISIQDNFFQLGGHSLLATQIISRLKTAYQVSLVLRDFSETPTIAQMAQAIRNQDASDQDTPKVAESALNSPANTPLAIEPHTDDIKTFPLSFSQEQLWLFEQFQPGNTAYNLPVNLRLQGPLRIELLERCLQEINQRHQALRTTLSTVDGNPIQRIGSAAATTLPLVDLVPLSPSQRQAEACRLAVVEAKKPFDLSAGPLSRYTLLKLGAEDHVLLISMHHTVSDGWSMGIFNRELVALYEAYAQGNPSPLTAPLIQYVDYAVWQRSLLAGAYLAQRLSFWEKQLQGMPPLLKLPTDRPRPATQSYQGARYTLTLPQALSQALREFSQDQGVTLFTTLLTAFKVLLYRYTSNTDIFVGTPVANRSQTEVEGLIGFFVNIIVLRTNLVGDLSFRQTLEQVKTTTLDAFANEDVPFGLLVDHLQTERDPSYNPLFQVVFALQNAYSPIEAMGDLAVSSLDIDPGFSQFDLSLDMFDNEAGLQAVFEYSTDLFDRLTIVRMADHLQTLLDGIVADPGSSIATLPIMNVSERDQLLVEWNDTRRDYPREACIQHLFEERAKKNPDAIAVVHEGQHLTYRELNQRANRLAHRLQDMGVTPDTLVGICVERSLEMVVGLLGILKAGGAYVPLDPTYPQERLAFILQDTQISLLLTQQRLQRAILSDYRGKVICLDANWPSMGPLAAENPVSSTTFANLAYVIYTSGSTGKPKGVMVEHRSLVNYVEMARTTFELDSTDRILQFASISFDAAAEEIYPCLTQGATLVLRPAAMLDSLATFLQMCKDLNLTILDLPTAFWHRVADALSNDEMRLPPPVRLVIIGGEKALPEQLQNWHKHIGQQVRLFNTYGPTEATIVATMFELTDYSVADAQADEIPIGTPVSNTQAYVLDNHLQPVPIGVPGELYIGGDGVARGYLNRPELMQGKFIANPFSQKTGTRLYKTGDRVCYLPDGNIEFIGRVDRQVKVRGFRIELGEIEIALSKHPAVQEAIVVADDSSGQTSRFLAYVTLEPSGTATDKSLRNFLKTYLPDYMLPSFVLILDSFPLTSNGKIDYSALPQPERSRLNGADPFVTPRTPTEQRLTKIFQEVLSLDAVSIDDNFFELGGNSLLAAYLFYQIEVAFGTKYPLATLFKAPTVAQLARALSQEEWRTPWNSLVPIKPKGSKPPLYFVHAHGGNVVGYSELANHLPANQPFYGIQAQSLNQPETDPQSFEEMAAYYISEIKTIQPTGPYFIGGWCLGADVALEMAHQLKEQGDEVGLVILLENPRPDYYLNYKPGTTAMHKHYYRLATRLDLELSNLLEVEPGRRGSFVLARTQRLLGTLFSAGERKLNKLLAKLNLPGHHSKYSVLDQLAQSYDKAYTAYTPKPYYGRTLLLRAAKQLRGVVPDPTLGWGRYLKGAVEIRQIPGHRIGALDEPRVQIVAKVIIEAIENVPQPNYTTAAQA